jgi:serine/threonine-protein kinase
LLADSHLIAATPVVEEWSDEFDAGAVIRTDPGVGESLKKDSAVNLVVSKGPQPVTVPDVRNQPKDKAIAKLKDVGLNPSVTGEEFSDSVPAGSVISQSVSGTVAKNTPVGLVISKGPELIQVPDVRGEKLNKAKKILEDLGFQVTTIEAPFGPKKVYDQNPGPGAMKPRGTKIQLFVV